MPKHLKLLLAIFALSLPFWWLFNAFAELSEDFFYTRELAKKPLLLAQISSHNFGQNPQRINNVPELELPAKAAISVLVDGIGREFPLFRKNTQEKLPIASITKLATALTAADIYSPSLAVVVSTEAVQQPEAKGELKVGEKLRVQDLLKILLVESSNDAAFALSQIIGENNFVAMMNLETESLGLENTFFINPSGLDPEDASKKAASSLYNYSSAEDLVELTKYLIFQKPELFEILGYNDYPLELENGALHHILQNTNELLGKMPEVLGGKTGYTERAGECLIVILKGPRSKSYFINAVLGAKNKFQEMENLINWVETSYQF